MIYKLIIFTHKPNNMKKFLVAILALITFTSSAQIRKVETDIFTVFYSQDLEQPLQLTYTVDCWDGEYSRSGMDFYEVEDVHTSDNEDYRNNVWDKGHLAPAAAFKCTEEELRATFSYLNCALQHEGLNRGPWRSLEAEERRLAEQYGSVFVVILVNFQKIERVPGGAAIPTSFIKIIYTDDGMFTYLFPNENVRGRHYLEFLINASK